MVFKKGHIPWNKKERTILVCQYCGKTFKVKPSIADTRKSCSKKCYFKTLKKRYKGNGNPMYGKKRPDLVEYNKTHIKRGKDNPNFGNHILKGKSFTSEHKEKIHLAQLKNGKTPIFRERMRKQRMSQILPMQNTSIEIKLQEELKRRNINFVPHYKFNGRFEIDIAVPSKRVAIEADGTYYHNYPYGLPRDKTKNAYLSKCGWTVLRFWEHEINENPERCVDKIEEELKLQ